MPARFKSLEELVAALGGRRVLRRVLIANNGIAALKGIRSMRQWAYEMLGDEGAVQFVCMATPEDIKVNVEYIKMADETVEVPGGRNSNNYANVSVIVEIAKQTGCDAVWAGWGHASENPELPRKLKEFGITFLGPPEGPMHALGDKIASTIIAQTAQVPTIAWSGSGLQCSGDTNEVPQETFDAACIRDAAHCVEVCKGLGFPLMIKASEGGGGKGIRMVNSIEEVENAYHAVAGEVLRSPIFVMRLAADVRHLEVQLLADEQGNVMSLRTRDCSVQRRHQKIIEEGPVVKTIPGTLQNMEAAAVRLAKMVGYRSVGTVEYLYHKGTGAFYFLELNPRLQVEHTVTELITGVNLPACMLCVGMGISLDRIPDVRGYYSKGRFTSDPINFEKDCPSEPNVHTIACRITAENPDDSFAPSSGSIEELTFRNSKNAWGYFSISSHGGVHEFADSQFGHIFSTAATREEAIAGMVLALKQLTIRGEIRTTQEYLLKLLDMPAFKDSDISTAWLDGLIRSRLRVEAPNPFLSVLCAATFKAVERFDANKAKYLSFLEAGHVPSSELMTTQMPVSLVLDQVKYDVVCTKASANEWLLQLCSSHILVGYRRLADRGLLLSLEGGRSPVVYAEEDAACLRVNIDGRTATFTHEVDPTKLRSQMPGKLVRFLVKDGEFVKAHSPFCEVEVMKMYIQLKTAVTGTISLKAQPGTTVHAGKILAVVEPDDLANIVRAEENVKQWPPIAQMWGGGDATPLTTPRSMTVTNAQPKAKKAVEICCNLISGFDMPKEVFEKSLVKIAEGLKALNEPDVTLTGLAIGWLVSDLDPEQRAAFDSKTAGTQRVIHVLKRLCERFLDVEALYEGGKLQQEVVDGLRSEREADKLQEVFDIQLAHSGAYRYRVMSQLLTYTESYAPELRVVLQRISALNAAKASAVVFSARHLLRKIDLPCADFRRQELKTQLTAARKDKKAMKELVDELAYGTDVISSFLMDNDNDALQPALELFLRRVYAGAFEMSDLHCDRLKNDAQTWFAHWTLNTKSNQNPLRHDGISGSTSSEDLDKLGEKAPENAKGILGIFDSVETSHHRLGDVLAHASSSVDTVCKVIIREVTHEHGVLASKFQATMREYSRLLEASRVTRVTFIVIRRDSTPLYYTFRRSLGFQEDTTYRHIAPTLAYMLELPKLKNYDIDLYQGNPVSQVHVYIAREKRGARSKPLALKPRLFVRCLVLPSDINSPSLDGLSDLTMYDAERAFANCIQALEIATSDRNLPPTAASHILINFEGLKTEYSKLDSVCEQISTVHAASLFRMGVVEVEIKLFCTLRGNEQPVLMRLFVSNPTTHMLQLENYIEVEDATNPGRSILVHVTAEGDVEDTQDESSTPINQYTSAAAINVSLEVGDLAVPTPMVRSNSNWEEGSTDSLRSPNLKLRVRTTSNAESQQHGYKKALFWHQKSPLTPYPLLTPYQLRRLLALENGTIYVYDWVALFEKCLRDAWTETIEGRSDMPGLEHAMPRDLLIAQELVYSNGVLKSTLRAPGENKVGMVGWKWTMFHPSHYDPATGKVTPRDIYVVANDITVLSGSFSTQEDELYAAIGRACRMEGLPLVYLSSNSGARIGLDPELKKLFKIKPSKDPNSLFEYLYLDGPTKEKVKELEEKTKRAVCYTEEIVDEDTGVTQHKITAIVGSQWGLGVENLSGSGMIAGEMALCYDEIPTISVATGRTVGIGAYLVRLGRRVVQVKGSPIILTGNNALNKLLGKEVYTSNSQLGGVNIMGPNGVTHWVASHNLFAVEEVMKWLDYVPDRVPSRLMAKSAAAALLPHPVPALHRVSKVRDPVDRDVAFTPQPNTPYDCRCLIAGQITEDKEWVSGLFDKDSFQEAQKDWAKTVCAGRATLGGIPVGVIAVETRAIGKFTPADPADPTSISAMQQQAGMVWYPDSARKTADFLADIDRENLPAIVLANWRGFSGGMRDMYDEVLKFGADIVQNLTRFSKPVIVYIPPFGELRGGAWVVIDPTINKKQIEMFVDPTARGGVLEPSGIIEIKYRAKEIYDTMDRLDPECFRLANQCRSAEGDLKNYLDRQIKEKHEKLFPLYKAVAHEFADLHDRPGRMLAVKSIDGVVPWVQARRMMYWRLRMRLIQNTVNERLEQEANVPAEQQKAVIAQWFNTYAAGGKLINGQAYDARPAIQQKDEEGNDLGPLTWVGATDKQKCEYFDSILGSELDSAMAEVKKQVEVDRIVKQLSGDAKLSAAVMARLNEEQE